MADPQLTTFAKHCRHMAMAEHTPECARSHRDLATKLRMVEVFGFGWGEPDQIPQPCYGCITEGDRQLWTQIADEINAYLNGDLEEQTTDHPGQLTLDPG